MQSQVSQLFLYSGDAVKEFNNRQMTWNIDFSVLLGRNCQYGKKFNIILNNIVTQTLSASSSIRTAEVNLGSPALQFSCYRVNNGRFGKTTRTNLGIITHNFNASTTTPFLQNFNLTFLNTFELVNNYAPITITYQSIQASFPKLTAETLWPAEVCFVFTIVELVTISPLYRFLPKTNKLVLNSREADVNNTTITQSIYNRVNFGTIIDNLQLNKKYNLVLRAISAENLSGSMIPLEIRLISPGITFGSWRPNIPESSQKDAVVGLLNSDTITIFSRPFASSTPRAWITTFSLTREVAPLTIQLVNIDTNNTSTAFNQSIPHRVLFFEIQKLN